MHANKQENDGQNPGELSGIRCRLRSLSCVIHAPDRCLGVSHFQFIRGHSRAFAAIPLILCALCVSAVNSDTSPQRITHDGKRKEDLAWSPDGSQLACSYYHQRGRIGIAMMNAEGGDLRVLTPDPVERAPGWSLDGKQLVFVHVTQSGTDGELDLHQMAADGSDRKPLVGGKSFENFPSFSPDGKKLLFTTTRDKTQEIYVADADGSNLKRLTSDPTLKQYPRWSPDGSRILFNANPDGNFDLYSIAATGGDQKRLTDDPAMDTCPAWSPDGKQIAWVSLRDENLEIYVAHADGTSPRNLSRHPGYDYSPAWKPDGTLTWVSDRDGRYDVYALSGAAVGK